jgi:hypothetical protein
MLAAPTAGAATPSMGLELGMSYASFAGSDRADPYVTGWRWLPRAAVLATFTMPNGFRLSPVLEYVERGETRRTRRFLFAEDRKLRERSIALGLQWSHAVLPGLALVAGPQVAYLLQGETWGSQDGYYGPVGFRLDYTDRASRLDALAKLGLEAEVKVGRHFLSLQGNWTSTASAPLFTTDVSRPRAAELGVGLRW